MKNNCFEIGAIQAFLDGELATGLSEKLVKHVAGCDACALMLDEAEEENTFAFGALDNEFNVLVPTERLRTKLFSAIEEIENERHGNLWQRLQENFGILGGINFRSPSLVALCCTLLFVGTFAFFLKVYPPMPGDLAVNTPASTIDNPIEIEPAPQGSDDEGAVAESEVEKAPEEAEPVFTVEKAGGRNDYRRESSKARRFEKPKIFRASTGGTRSITSPPAVEGEDVYLQTIFTLNRNLGQEKDEILRPRERIEFERNLAMVNNVIVKMKDEVRKNPKNQAAKELLKSSYQNKIDLLNSVSERNELMASIQ